MASKPELHLITNTTQIMNSRPKHMCEFNTVMKYMLTGPKSIEKQKLFLTNHSETKIIAGFYDSN